MLFDFVTDINGDALCKEMEQTFSRENIMFETELFLNEYEKDLSVEVHGNFVEERSI